MLLIGGPTTKAKEIEKKITQGLEMLKFFKFLNSAFLLVSLLACNGMGKDEIPNFKYKDTSNYYFKIDDDSYSVKILRDYNDDNLGRAIDIKECAIIYKNKTKNGASVMTICLCGALRLVAI